MVQAVCHQLGPTQGCQELSCTKCEMYAVAATCSTSVTLLPQCTQAPTERHSSPVEAVLTGSEVTLPGLIEIPRSPGRGDTALLTNANTIITFKGSRLQPRYVLDASRPTQVRHQPHAGNKGEPDEWIN